MGPVFHDGVDMDAALSGISKEHILQAGKDVAVFGRSDKRTRKHLLETIALLGNDVQDAIRSAALLKNGSGRAAKRARMADPNPPPLVTSTAEPTAPQPATTGRDDVGAGDSVRECDQFLQTVS